MSWIVEAAFGKTNLAHNFKDIQFWLESNYCDPNAVEIVVRTCTMLLIRVEFPSERLAREFASAFAGSMAARPILLTT